MNVDGETSCCSQNANAAASEPGAVCKVEPRQDMFDPTDPKWQVQVRYPPNKVGTWPPSSSSYGNETDDVWALDRNALRSEFCAFREAIEMSVERNRYYDEEPVPDWVVSSIEKWWYRGHFSHVSGHLKAEGGLEAFLCKRFACPEALNANRPLLDDCLGAIDDIAGRLSSASDDGMRRSLLKDLGNACVAYEASLLSRLTILEEECMPLTRAYFCPRDLRTARLRYALAMPRVATGSIIHHVGEAKFRDVILEQARLPLRNLVWRWALKPRLLHYRKHIAVHTESLLAGNPPVRRVRPPTPAAKQERKRSRMSSLRLKKWSS